MGAGREDTVRPDRGVTSVTAKRLLTTVLLSLETICVPVTRERITYEYKNNKFISRLFLFNLYYDIEQKFVFERAARIYERLI